MYEQQLMLIFKLSSFVWFHKFPHRTYLSQPFETLETLQRMPVSEPGSSVPGQRKCRQAYCILWNSSHQRAFTCSSRANRTRASNRNRTRTFATVVLSLFAETFLPSTSGLFPGSETTVHSVCQVISIKGGATTGTLEKVTAQLKHPLKRC